MRRSELSSKTEIERRATFDLARDKGKKSHSLTDSGNLFKLWEELAGGAGGARVGRRGTLGTQGMFL